MSWKLERWLISILQTNPRKCETDAPPPIKPSPKKTLSLLVTAQETNETLARRGESNHQSSRWDDQLLRAGNTEKCCQNPTQRPCSSDLRPPWLDLRLSYPDLRPISLDLRPPELDLLDLRPPCPDLSLSYLDLLDLRPISSDLRPIFQICVLQG